MLTTMVVVAAVVVSASVVVLALLRSSQPVRSVTQILADLESPSKP